MLHFTPVTAESMPLLRPYYETCPYRLCEYSSGVKYMWRGHLRSEYAFTDGCLVIRNCIDGVPQFDYPIPGPEGDVDAALTTIGSLLEHYSARRGAPLAPRHHHQRTGMEGLPLPRGGLGPLRRPPLQRPAQPHQQIQQGAPRRGIHPPDGGKR